MKVLSMTLQPLVENALLHGISGLTRPGIILIWAQVRKDRFLILRIIDNGKGMPTAQLQKIRNQYADDGALEQGDHIGLRNIARRLGLFFGETFDIDISSIAGHYTSISLRIPCDIVKEGLDL